MSCSRITRFGPDPLLDQEVATKAYVDNNAGGGGAFANLVKTVDETIDTDSVLHDDTELFFTPNINKTYWGWICAIVDTTGTPDYKHAFTVPTGGTAIWYVGAGILRHSEIATNNALNAQNIGITGQPRWVITPVMIETGATAGVVNYQWAQQTSNAAPTTLNRGSSLVMFESA